MITAHHLVFGRKYIGIAYWAIDTNTLGSAYRAINISTRNSDISVDWKDGITNNYTTSKNLDFTTIANNSNNGILSHTYSSAVVANIEIKINSGLSDVYSLHFGGYGFLLNSDFGAFVKQFSNLYSLNIDIPHSVAFLSGDISQIPDSLEKIYIRDLMNSGNLYLNISNFNINSQLKEFKSIDGQYNHNGFTNVYGDLSKLPPLVKIFTLKDNLANTFTYTTGKVWASSFDTLDIGNATIGTFQEVDNLLIDMNNSITTAIGAKIIRLAKCTRSNASDNAVASLTAKGFTITIGERYGMLITNLSNKIFLNDISQDIIVSGTVRESTDHKGGNNAMLFKSDNVGSLKTVNNFPESEVWSISFWFYNKSNTSEYFLKLINESLGYIKFLFISTNTRVANRITVVSTNVVDNQYNEKNILLPSNKAWYHIVIVFDRSQVGHTNEIKFYVNGVLNANQISTGATDQTGLFTSGKVTLGEGFTGYIEPPKFYNRALTQTEITNLYNE